MDISKSENCFSIVESQRIIHFKLEDKVNYNKIMTGFSFLIRVAYNIPLFNEERPVSLCFNSQDSAQAFQHAHHGPPISEERTRLHKGEDNRAIKEPGPRNQKKEN